MSTALVIGAGPAGLMAAEVLAGAGVAVTLADQMPSPARKFLMAGKSGLNLTKAEAGFAQVFAPPMRGIVEGFGPEDVVRWAEGLGQAVFTGSTGRVFPVAMKASPLLRAWLGRLDALGVRLERRWRWTGWDEGAVFDTPGGRCVVAADVVVLALGGASWRRLGSDGLWAGLLDGVAPFAPANCGFVVDWSRHMAPHLGQPVKGVGLRAGALASRGEFVVSARGLEGGGIYAVSAAVRDGAPLLLDLFPDRSAEDLRAALARPRGKASLSTHLRKALGLSGVRLALLQEFGRPLPDDLAGVLKALPVRHDGPRPLDEAISVAGGLRFGALDAALMLRARPGVFAAGEMLDWEAPTGGYLITGCLATGRHAAMGALRYLGRG